MRGRGGVWTGDALRALAALQVDDPGVENEVLAVLGLERRLEVLRGETRQTVPPKQKTDARQRESGPSQVDKQAEQRPVVGGLKVEALAPVESQREPTWLRRSEPMHRVVDPYEPGPPEPIFPKRSERGILVALVATLAETNHVDVEQVILRIAHSCPLTRLPFMFEPSLRRGAVLLLDRGAGMAPFRSDQAQLARALRAIVPDLDELAFQGCPRRSLRRTRRWDRRPIVPPSPGTPVIAVTDLGIGGQRDAVPVPVWRQWADAVARRGARPIALVPYRRERWPEGLPRVMRMVPWDARSSAARVRNWVGSWR